MGGASVVKGLVLVCGFCLSSLGKSDLLDKHGPYSSFPAAPSQSFLSEKKHKKTLWFQGKTLEGSGDHMVLKNHVIIVHDSLKLFAQEAFLQFVDTEVTEVFLKTSVRVLGKDSSHNPLKATAGWAHYHLKNQILTLKEKVKIFRGESQLKGEIVIYNGKRGIISVQRVEGEVQIPKKQESTP